MSPDANPVGALRALRSARQRKRLVRLEWFELAYKVYVAALAVLGAVVLISNIVGDNPLTDSETADVFRLGPPAVGVALAAAVLMGLRSGARGGPLSVEAADVQYVMLAPIDRRAVMMRPAVQQYRLAAFAGASLGGISGQLLGRRLERALIPWATMGALVGATIGVAFVASAFAAHLTRARRWQAALLGLGLLGWQVAAVPTDWDVPGPFDTLGSLALWPDRIHAHDLALPVAVALVALATLLGLRRISIDALARRTALVRQLRFAVTMRDLRTVILLRRQLSNEQLRVRPWFRLPRRLGTAVTRRGLHSAARLPAARVLRMCALSAIAGAAQVAAFRGTTPAVFVSALAAFVLGLECLEPFAQEVDQPDRCDSLPQARGWLLLRHLMVPAITSVLFGLVGAGTAMAIARNEVGWQLSLLLLLPVVWSGLGGAVLNVMAALPAPELPGSVNDMLPPEVAGTREVLRTIRPLLVAVAGSLPVLAGRAAWRSGDQPLPPALQAVVAVALVLAAVVWWARRRDEVRAKARNLWAAGGAEFDARRSQQSR